MLLLALYVLENFKSNPALAVAPMFTRTMKTTQSRLTLNGFALNVTKTCTNYANHPQRAQIKRDS